MPSVPTSTPEAAGGARGVAQAVAAPLTRAAIFLVVILNSEPENRATIRSFCVHARRLAVSHSRKTHGFMLRACDANYGTHRQCCFAGRRGARIPLLRRPRSHRLCRWN